MAIRISEAVQRLPRRILEQFDEEVSMGMTSNTTQVIKQLNDTLLSQENELMHLRTAVKDLRAELIVLRKQYNTVVEQRNNLMVADGLRKAKGKS